MPRKNKVSKEQMPMLGLLPYELPDATSAAVKTPEPEPTAAVRHEQQTDANPQQPARKPRRESDATRRHSAAKQTIHHHVIRDKRIVSCFDTLSEALHQRRDIKQDEGVDTVIESYSGDAECRRVKPFTIPKHLDPAKDTAQADRACAVSASDGGNEF